MRSFKSQVFVATKYQFLRSLMYDSTLLVSLNFVWNWQNIKDVRQPKFAINVKYTNCYFSLEVSMDPVEGNAITLEPNIQTSINDLPNELLTQHIFSQLNSKNFAAANLACKKWHVICETTSSYLKYQALAKEILTESQWKIIACGNPNFSELIHQLYSFRDNFDLRRNYLTRLSSQLLIHKFMQRINKGFDLSKVETKLLDEFLGGLCFFSGEKFVTKKCWGDSIFHNLWVDIFELTFLVRQLVSYERQWYLKEVWDKDRIGSLLEIEANNGQIDAQITLGYLYQFGDKEFGIPKDTKKALVFFQMAANQGSILIQHYLACAYVTGGKLVAQDWNLAMDYFSRIVDQEPGTLFLSSAYCGIAYCLINGANDAQKALENLQSAAKHNFVPAHLYLGTCLVNGLGMEKDWDKAFQHFSAIALELENPWACFALGCYFIRKNNWESASEYFLNAWTFWCERRHSVANLRLRGRLNYI